MERTNISWCDSTLNPWRGCTKVSPGCANCYAEALSIRFNLGKYQRGQPRIKSKSFVKDALAFNLKPWICDSCGVALESKKIGWNQIGVGDCPACKKQETKFHRRRIFSLSLGDWLDAEVPVEWLAEMLLTINKCSDVIWILCTKRPENFKIRLEAAYSSKGMGSDKAQADWIWHWANGQGCVPANIILLNSVENQAMADKRIPELLKIPAACHGLSLEPLLSEVNLGEWLFDPNKPIGWVIAGGESGSNARCCEVEWIRYTSIQCQETGTPFFCKQLGAASSVNGSPFELVDKKGGDPSEWPADLRVQEWPTRF